MRINLEIMDNSLRRFGFTRIGERDDANDATDIAVSAIDEQVWEIEFSA